MRVFSGGPTLPLTISACEWNLLTNNDPQIGNPGTLPTSERTMYFHSSQTAASVNTCGTTPPNADHPGGFGWLSTTSGCSVTVGLGTITTNTGNSVPSGCSQAYFQGLLGPAAPPILLPIFGSLTANANGSNASYNITGFAALKVTGYRFSGSQYNEPSTPPCSGNDRCIRGYFVAYHDLEGYWDSVGSPQNFGVVNLGLVR
jgi:hypothetical protein